MLRARSSRRPTVQEAPAVAARHVLHFHAAERREVRDHPVQVREHVVDLDATVPNAEVLLQLVQDARRVDREPIADRCREPSDFGKRAPQLRTRAPLEQVAENFLVPLAGRERRRHLRRQLTQRDHHAQQCGELHRRVARILQRHAHDHAAQQAQDVLRPLGLPPEPEQVVGDTARHVGGSPLLAHRRRRGRQQRHLAHGTVRQHPRVLAPAAALHRHDRAGRARPPRV